MGGNGPRSRICRPFTMTTTSSGLETVPAAREMPASGRVILRKRFPAARPSVGPAFSWPAGQRAMPATSLTPVPPRLPPKGASP